MKLLYLCFAELNQSSGIAKKMLHQAKVFEKNGFDVRVCYEKVEMNKVSRRILNSTTVLEEMKNNKIARQLLYYNYKKLIDYIINEGIEILYIRYVYIANPFFLKFLKKIKENNIMIILEIPTYPYDYEYKIATFLGKVKHQIEKVYRLEMRKYVDRIVAFSEDKQILGIETINISNGVSLEDISIINKVEKENKIEFIGVAKISYWHGFDRMISSIAEYYKKPHKKKVIFHIVGNGDQTVEKLKEIVHKNNLEKYVIFYGYKSGKELDEIYNKADIAVGCLGIFRKKIYKSSTLKVREYCAKGLPFIMGEEDLYIKEKPFIYKVENDESIFDIEKIIEWYDNLKISPEEIREYAKNNLTWDNQMRKIINYILESKEN